MFERPIVPKHQAGKESLKLVKANLKALEKEFSRICSMIKKLSGAGIWVFLPQGHSKTPEEEEARKERIAELKNAKAVAASELAILQREVQQLEGMEGAGVDKEIARVNGRIMETHEILQLWNIR